MVNYSKLKLVTSEESTDDPYWDTSRGYAKKIKEVIQKLDVMFTMDNLTVADGNCFTFAIFQQLHQPHIYQTLDRNLRMIVNRMDVLSFKQKVYEFTMNSPEVLAKQELIAIDMNDWSSYWKKMLRNGEMADTTFVQCTAWYLNMDLVIVSDTCNEENKFFKIHGYFDEDNMERLQLNLGHITNTHYQSIFAKKVGYAESLQKLPTKCPACSIEVNQLMKHLRNQRCKGSLGEAKISELRKIAAKESRNNSQSKYIATGGHDLAQKKYVESGRNRAVQAKYLERKRVEDYDANRKRQAQRFAKWNIRNLSI